MPPVAVANAGMNAQFESIKLENEQLRREARIQRLKLSECAKDIVAFCEKESKVDPLIMKVPASANPFIVRGPACSLT
ncbi:guanine nucleotide-binding protein subunit gamma [Hydra vulgaris]|uniref:guanine nucleotide-binding protein subunit gamma n=1 Tax=Hydra vulgaris TaxID=6087 RepID=UPI00019276A6|nr:guanine nucleotide-binding protein subunit gamma [Hydra vulgaris]